MRRRSGFTIIELLVGIVIFSVISVTLFLVVQSALAVREHQEDEMASAGKYLVVLDRLANELEFLHPAQSNRCEMALQGERLAFCSLFDPEIGLIELAYWLDGSELERAANPIGQPGSTNTILSGVSHFQVSTYEGGEVSDLLPVLQGTNTTMQVPPILSIQLGDEPPVERQVYLPLSLKAESRVKRQ